MNHGGPPGCGRGEVFGDLPPKWLVSGDETRPSIGWGPRLTGRILTLREVLECSGVGKRFPRGGVGGEGYLHAGPGDPGGEALPRLEIPRKGTESKLTLPKVWEEGGEGAMPPPGPLRPRRT